jgi:hypothetical protein
MADTLSLLVLDPLHTIMQGIFIEITVARALKPNCCNEDCYLLPKDTVMLVDTYGRCRGTGLPNLQVTTVRLVLRPDHLNSKLILSICNQCIAVPFCHNTTLCCKITTKLLSQQCLVWPLCEPEISYHLSVLVQHLWIDLKYSLVVIHMTYATKGKCSAHKLTVSLLQDPLAVKWYISLRCSNSL